MLAIQYILPQKCLSRFVGWLARREWGGLIQLWLRWFVKHYRVNMAEAANPDLAYYPSFNQFFTRELAEEARPMADALVVSPVDATVSALGPLTKGQLLQAKGHYYSLAALLASKIWATQFVGGSFLTAYLSPRDYHRIHMPVAGRLREMTYVPGKLFSVNQQAVDGIPDLFAKNERVIAYFDTEYGPMAMVLVGAMLVGQMEVVWQGTVNAHHESMMQTWVYDDQEIRLAQGEEMGRFNMGSTVILLFNHEAMIWDENWRIADAMQLGQALVSES